MTTTLHSNHSWRRKYCHVLSMIIPDVSATLANDGQCVMVLFNDIQQPAVSSKNQQCLSINQWMCELMLNYWLMEITINRPSLFAPCCLRSYVLPPGNNMTNQGTPNPSFFQHACNFGGSGALSCLTQFLPCCPQAPPSYVYCIDSWKTFCREINHFRHCQSESTIIPLWTIQQLFINTYSRLLLIVTPFTISKMQ